MKLLVVVVLVASACQGNKSGTFSFDQKFKTDSTRMSGPPSKETAYLADAMPQLAVTGAATAIVDVIRSELEGNAIAKRGNVSVELVSPLRVDLPDGSTSVELKIHAAFIDAPNVIVIDAKVAGPLKYTGADAKRFGKHLADEVVDVLEKKGKIPATAGPSSGKPAKPTGVGSGQPSCSVHEDKSVRCWYRADAPVLLPKAAGSLAVDGGQNFGACGLRNNLTVYCVAVGTSANLDVTDVCGVENAKAISIGDDAGCALLTDGSVTCWPDEPESFAPCKRGAFAVEGIKGATAIYAGPFHGVALMPDGSVKTWPLRDMKSAPKAKPVKGIAKATAVVSGFTECGAVGDTLVCVDAESGKKTTSKFPEPIVELVHAKATCARTKSGAVYCVYGDKVEKANLASVVDIDGDLAGLCGITASGDVSCTDGLDGKDTDPPKPVTFAM